MMFSPGYAFARGFWNGLCAPVLFFETLSLAGPSPPARYLSTDWKQLLDAIFGRPPREKRKRAVVTSTANRDLLTKWTESVPALRELTHLDQAIPGSAERVLTMIEAEHQARLERHRLSLKLAIRESTQGYWMGLSMVALSVGASVVTGLIGCEWPVSVALVGVPLLGVVRAFLPRRKTASRSVD